MLDDPKTRLLHAAGSVFADKGFAAATVRDICDRAGMNVAAVNYYFGGKDQIYQEAVREAHPARRQEQGFPAFPEGISAEEKLFGYIRRFVTLLLEPLEGDWQMRLFMRELMNPSPQGREILREHFENNFRILQQIIDELVPEELCEHRRHKICLSVIGQCVHYKAAVRIIPLTVGEEQWRQHYSVDDIADHVTRFTLAALGALPAYGTSVSTHARVPGSRTLPVESSNGSHRLSAREEARYASE